MLRKPLFWIVVIILVVVAYLGYGKWWGGIAATGSRCGDGTVALTEGCDDRNKRDNDGCNSDCKVEPGFTCTGSPSVCTAIVARCGDGFIMPSETCDDENAVSGDGCDEACQLEPGFICRGVPSVCEAV